MKKYIVTVYAICKNEEQFVNRWVNSMSEADNIVVLDTGSTDNTVKELKEHGAVVKSKIISPWRFDVARNESLKLVPKNTDICVCTDLDEVFEKGWRKKLEDCWQYDTQQLRYTYVWNILPNGQDGVTFLYEKIHALNNFKWIYPVHEVLNCSSTIQNNIVVNKDIVLRHYPDPTKSRGQYLNLLELSVKEDPTSDRNMHYLGREYMFHQRHIEAIKTLKRHLKLKTATWAEERSASCRFIADCYLALNKPKQSEFYYKKSVVECSTSREGYFALALFYYNKQDYVSCHATLTAMLQVTQKNISYITNPNCWNELPYDMLSFCYYKLGNLTKAKLHALQAFNINPNDERIKNNVKFYTNLTL